MHNPRHRRTAVPPPGRAIAPAFPADVAVPPHRGAAIRTAKPAAPKVAPEPGIAVLFAIPAKPKPAPKKRKPAAVRRKAQRKAKARGKPPPRGPKLTPAVLLPDRSEPLVLFAPAPTGRALVRHREPGLPALLAEWLSGRLLALWDRMGGLPTARPAPRRKKASAQDLELIRLRAENARLKRQMNALLALPPAPSSPRPVSNAPNQG